jgi:peptidoglycan hydrolase-like protein with peptidoglycan-binding domain
MNNGNEASGDGWRYRGRGLKQLTGKYNYTLASKDLGVDLLKNPDYLETPEGAARSAAWFWSYNNLNKFADAKDILGSTKAINGGTNGLEDRKKFYDRALNSIDLSSEKQPRNKLVIAQQKLGLTADGVLGPITKKAISEFQKSKKLPITGDLDEITFNELTK